MNLLTSHWFPLGFAWFLYCGTYVLLNDTVTGDSADDDTVFFDAPSCTRPRVQGGQEWQHPDSLLPSLRGEGGLVFVFLLAIFVDLDPRPDSLKVSRLNERMLQSLTTSDILAPNLRLQMMKQMEAGGVQALRADPSCKVRVHFLSRDNETQFRRRSMFRSFAVLCRKH